MKEGFIKELNALIASFQRMGVNYEQHIGQCVSQETECVMNLREDIPEKLKEVIGCLR